MNGLNTVDKKLIEGIKNKIAQASGIDSDREWMQKDYTFLVFFIEEKTGVRLSLSTVKRIWRNEYNRLPHISTLNALSQLAYGMDWHLLKKQRLERETPSPPGVTNKKRTLRKPALLIALVIVFAVITVTALSLVTKHSDKVIVGDGKTVEFSCRKSVGGKVPNTVVFSYDVKSVDSEKFFIQQSWDQSRRVEVSKENSKQTDIYYTPGYFTARLLADTRVIKEIPVHITYNDWFIAVRQPISKIRTFEKQYWSDEKYLGIEKNTLASAKVDLSEGFSLGFYNVREFGVDGDNYTYTSMFRMDSLATVVCPNLGLLIKGEKERSWIMFTNKGCESELRMNSSDISYDGKKYDLTMFGCDIYQWQKITIAVVDKKFTIELNDNIIFEGAYNNPVGPLKDISYFFEGIGMIDNVELKDRSGQVRFFDNFD